MTPGIEGHQHYSNCLERNKYNRCICVIHSYDMTLSLCSFVITKLAVKTSRLRKHALDRKDFIKTNFVLLKTLVTFFIIFTLMDFPCVTQSYTIDRAAVARNGSMDKFWKRWSGLKCVLLAWKPLLKVTFCVIIAWAIPSDVKKSFCYRWVAWGDASSLNCKYFLEMLGYYPSIPNIPSCARVSKSVRTSQKCHKT